MFRILVPVDFSINSTHALRYALNLAPKLDARITIFHSNILPMPVGEVPIITDPADRQLLLKRMQQTVARLAASQNQKPAAGQLEFMVRDEFSVGAAVREYAKSIKADLIIMGTRGASGLKKVFLGSNTVDVISSTPIPILSVPERYQYRPVRSILMPSDLRGLAAELKLAIPISKLMGARLEVLFLSDSSESAMDLYDAANRLIKKNPYEKLKLSLQARTYGKSVAADIQSSLKSKKPGMLIMFRHRHSWWGNLLQKSQTDQVAFSARIPMLVLREP